MDQQKTKSRGSVATICKSRLLLIALCVVAMSAVIAGLQRFTAYAQSQKGGLSDTIDESRMEPTATPLPYFSVTWTATADGHRDTNDGGVRTVETRHVVMSGFGIVRKLDNLPNGAQDAFPFGVTVSDDYDVLTTAPCSEGGESSLRQNWYVNDPFRDDPGPDAWLKIPGTVHRPDGTWYIQDPFLYFNGGRLRHYKAYIESKQCNSAPFLMDASSDNASFAAVLGWPGQPDVLTIEGDQNGRVFTKNRTFTVGGGGTGGMELTVNWSVTARLLIDRDLTVERLEVTQGLQDGANSIPLVQGRRTVVRAYLGLGRDQTPIDSVTARLKVFSGSTELGSVNPFNPGGRITAPVSIDWMKLNDTLNFEVPLAWTRMPSLRFEVEVNPDASIFETDFTNNKLSASLTSKDCNNGINIGYLPIHFTPPEGNFGFPADPNAKIANAQEFMRKIYPVPESGLKYSASPGMVWTESLNYPDAGDRLLNALEQRRINSSPRNGHIFGWLPIGGYTFASGFSLLPGGSAWGTDGSRYKVVLSHEIGHNKGLTHSAEGTGGSHWFDVYERSIKPPFANQQLLGLMINPAPLGAEYWISPTQYRFLMSKMCTGGTQLSPESIQTPTVTDNLILTGIVSNLAIAAGSLDPLYRTTTAANEIPPVGTAYCVKLKNAAGTVLSQYCFYVSFDGEDGVAATGAPFGMSVPYPAGLNRVELTRGTKVLSSRVASTNAPVVTLNFPNAPGLTLSGVQNVTWTGSDPDGGTLTYSLLHSSDNGTTWVGIGNGIVGNSYTLDFSSLPGGTSSRIKVMVSDGFRSAEDVSDNPFNIANKPPVAAIVSPPTGINFPANTKLTLQASGSDLEDGSLADAAFRWSSDRDGFLGNGQVLEVNLSVGNHIITMTAQDSGGLTTTATIASTSVSTALSTPVTVSGRVTTPTGLGLKGASVSIVDSIGVRRSVLTNQFGHFILDSVRTGETYTIGVSSKRFRFSQRLVQVTGDLTMSDFVGQE